MPGFLIQALTFFDVAASGVDLFIYGPHLKPATSGFFFAYVLLSPFRLR
jgi:hypothetical protein